MEYLQYSLNPGVFPTVVFSFKPYYKWNTFNTLSEEWVTGDIIVKF